MKRRDFYELEKDCDNAIKGILMCLCSAFFTLLIPVGILMLVASIAINFRSVAVYLALLAYTASSNPNKPYPWIKRRARAIMRLNRNRADRLKRFYRYDVPNQMSTMLMIRQGIQYR